MKISSQGLQTIISFEAMKLAVYKDSAGLDTIGVGHLITKSEKALKRIDIDGVSVDYVLGLTKSQAIALFRQDLKIFEEYVANVVTVRLKQHQYDALVSFVFNVGCTAFKSSTMFKLLQSGDYNGVGFVKNGVVGGQFIRWNKADGRVIKGLVNRRASETRLWALGIYPV